MYMCFTFMEKDYCTVLFMHTLHSEKKSLAPFVSLDKACRVYMSLFVLCDQRKHALQMPCINLPLYVVTKILCLVVVFLLHGELGSHVQ